MADARVSVAVTSEPISAAALLPLVRDDRAGAIATFEGAVRNHHAGKTVAFLEYEAYIPMAESELGKIAERARERWPIEAIAIHHRIGRLEIGEISVALAVSSAHRNEAFEALRWAIDTLKETVPIWKRETGPDGTFWIEGPEQVPAAD